MVEIEWNKSNLKHFYDDYDSLYKSLLNKVQDGLNAALDDSKKYALSQKKGNKDSSLIGTNIYRLKYGVTGRLYTKFDFAPFLEYGTGIYAELPHIGTTITFKKSGFKCWYAPKELVKNRYPDNAIVEIDNMKLPANRKFNSREYVLVFSQQPQPFMRPTAFNRRKANVNAIKEAIRKV